MAHTSFIIDDYTLEVMRYDLRYDGKAKFCLVLRVPKAMREEVEDMGN